MAIEVKKDLSALWSEVGNHGGRLTNIEKDLLNFQNNSLHWQVNHRAETNGVLKEFREEMYHIIGELKSDFKTLLVDVNHIKKFMYMVFGVGGAVSSFFVIIINWSAIKSFFGV